jgi:hypothetical protein
MGGVEVFIPLAVTPFHLSFLTWIIAQTTQIKQT